MALRLDGMDAAGASACVDIVPPPSTLPEHTPRHERGTGSGAVVEDDAECITLAGAKLSL
jgi:hypothetical protein